MARCQPGLQIINTEAASGDHFRQRTQGTLQTLDVANTELSRRESLTKPHPCRTARNISVGLKTPGTSKIPRLRA